MPECDDAKRGGAYISWSYGNDRPGATGGKRGGSHVSGASVDTIMITGDHVDTAFAIAKQLGIANKMSECMTGEELERLSAGELQRKLRQTKVFARVAPEHKVQIIKGLKASGKIVAMTGDGVNDAPSLKAADIALPWEGQEQMWRRMHPI